ncbi:aldose 1-epimerase [Sphaerochaeta globosa]|uniref:Aldose 1-epimerase n=1 Tax=Sphaerochaeta globosa (strain ATCC BAA-1886 / DSM 22777 / Buddy) TaxID=158189 RepID=F0RWD4_SPHGB|nr:aldose 1-epimerase [Sphaerochaeta globosa]ADY13565.1 Aldose 1-epimerase [Sphaerochaeta globosa str. Buddy]
MITLHQNNLVMEISEVGAEIHSLYNTHTNIQYIFDGNPVYWARHTPLLFPVTGPLKDGKVQAKGKTYAMPVNGFARDLQFDVVTQKKNEATFVLHANEQTRAFYPYEFSLTVTHTLLDNGYSSKAVITAKEALSCTFGWHPAFSLAMNGPDAPLQSYYIEFETQESADRLYPVQGIFAKQAGFLDKQSTLALSLQELDKGPIVLNGLKSRFVSLKSKNGKAGVTIDRGDLPTLVIWTKEKAQAPYVCVEPMYSFQDASRKSELSEMEGMMHLAQGESRTFCNTFTVF